MNICKKYVVKRIDTPEELLSIRDEWNELYQNKIERSHSQSFLWNYLFIRNCLNEIGDLSIFLFYRDAKLVAIAPFALKKWGIFSEYYFCSENTQADYLDLLVDDLQDGELGYFLGSILEKQELAFIKLKKVPGNSELLDRLKRAGNLKIIDLPKEPCVQIKLENSIEDFTQKLGKSTRREIKSVENRIEKTFSKIEINYLYKKDLTEELLKLLLKMYRHRRAEKLGKEVRSENYFRFLWDYISESENVFISLLKIEGKIVAFNIGFFCGGNKIEILITCFDKEYKKYQVGNYLLYQTIKAIIEGRIRGEGKIKEYDLGQGDELYKIKYGGVIRQIEGVYIFKNKGFYEITKMGMNLLNLMKGEAKKIFMIYQERKGKGEMGENKDGKRVANI